MTYYYDIEKMATLKFNGVQLLVVVLVSLCSVGTNKEICDDGEVRLSYGDSLNTL